jgi:hypothetical protein
MFLLPSKLAWHVAFCETAIAGLVSDVMRDARTFHFLAGI